MTVFAADKTIEATGSLGTYNWTPETADDQRRRDGGIQEHAGQSRTGCTWKSATRQRRAARASQHRGTPGTGAGHAPSPRRGPTRFHCPVHPTEMTGTITVSGTGPQPPVVTTGTGDRDQGHRSDAEGQASTPPEKRRPTSSNTARPPPTARNHARHQPASRDDERAPKSATVSGLTAGDRPTTSGWSPKTAPGRPKAPTAPSPPAAPPTATTEPGDGSRQRRSNAERHGQPERPGNQILLQLRDDEAYGQKTSRNDGPGREPSNVAASKLVTGLSPETDLPLPGRRQKLRGRAAKSKEPTRPSRPPAAPVATTGQASGVGETTATAGRRGQPPGPDDQILLQLRDHRRPTARKPPKHPSGKGTSNVNVSAPLTGSRPGTDLPLPARRQKRRRRQPQALDQTFTTASTPPPPHHRRPPGHP